MSNLVVPDVGEVKILQGWINNNAGNLSLRLFQNNYTPVDASVLGSFTVATFPGYANVVPAMGSAATVANKAKSTSTASYDFTCTGGGASQSIYGYYVVDTAAGEVLWAERFDSLVTMLNNGDKITITLVLTLFSQF